MSQPQPAQQPSRVPKASRLLPWNEHYAIREKDGTDIIPGGTSSSLLSSLSPLSSSSTKWYYGKNREVPLHKDVEDLWYDKTQEPLNRYLITLLKGIPRKPPYDCEVEIILCMAGHVCTREQELPGGALFSTNLVLLKPTVVMNCREDIFSIIKKAKLEKESPLKEFFTMSGGQLHIGTNLPILLSGPGAKNVGTDVPIHLSGPDAKGIDTSLYIQYGKDIYLQFPAKSRFLCGGISIYSTIGGTLFVDGEEFGLTTAHGVVRHLLSPKDDGTSSETLLDSDVDEETWEKSQTPHTLAYLGRGTRGGDYTFPEKAPPTSDFALAKIPGSRRYWGDSSKRFLPNSRLPNGDVTIPIGPSGLELHGYLLLHKSYIMIGGVFIETRRVQISSHESPSAGSSGAFIISGRDVCGILFAKSTATGPYLHMLPIGNVLRDIYHFKHPKTALYEAAKGGYMAAVEILVQELSESNHATGGMDQASRNELEKNLLISPLVLAAREGSKEIVNMLLQLKLADINSENRDRCTPLRAAIQYQREDIVSLLLNQENIDLNRRSLDSLSPLTTAVRSRNLKIVRMLLDKKEISIDTKDKSGIEPFREAIRLQERDILRALLDRMDVGSNLGLGSENLLILAAQHGDSEITEMLFGTGKIDVHERDSRGETLLLSATKSFVSEIVKTLLDMGADVNAKDDMGETPLLSATSSSKSEIVKMLLEKGADVNAKNNIGETPLLSATRLSSSEIVKMLVSRGADINATDAKGWSPLIWATRNSNLEAVDLLLGHGAYVNVKGPKGLTSLHYAVKASNIDVAKALLKREDVDVNSRSSTGTSPLMEAVNLERTEIVEILLQDLRTIVDFVDVVGRTSLSWAALSGYGRMVELLLEAKADVNHRDTGGDTPMTLARSYRHTECVRIMEQALAAQAKYEDDTTVEIIHSTQSASQKDKEP